jgi:TRAP-type C4-dicarboxylate transport system permease small subunit
MARLLSVIDSLGRLGGAFAALALAALTLIILSEITVRLLSNYIDGFPAAVPMAWEFSSYLMGIAFMAGAAMTLRAGSHIRVSILIGQLPAGGRRVLEVIASATGLALTTFLAWSLALFTWGSYSRGQTSISSDTPVWIPEAAITLGAVLLALQMFARLIQALWGLPVEDPSLKVASTTE